MAQRACLPPPVIRSLYRSVLRASAFGTRPEVLLWRDVTLPAVVEGQAERLPETPADVRKVIRYAFETHPVTGATAGGEIAALFKARTNAQQIFSQVRDVNTLAATLHPAPTDFDGAFPAFVMPSTPLTPGEPFAWRFFEPRYKRMCEYATGLTVPPKLSFASSGRVRKGKGGENDKRFVVIHEPKWVTDPAPPRRASPDEPHPVSPVAGTMFTIVDLQQTPEGEFLVQGVAGSRVEVTAWEHEPVNGGEPLTHVKVRPFKDDGSHVIARIDIKREQAESKEEETEAEALDRLLKTCNTELEALHKRTGFLGGRPTPPVFDPEAMSHYVIGTFVGTGKQSPNFKRALLDMTSTIGRLDVAASILKNIHETIDRAAANESRPKPDAGSSPDEQQGPASPSS